MKVIGIVSFMNSAGAQEALLRLMQQLRLRGHDTETWFLYRGSSQSTPGRSVRLLSDKAALSPLGYLQMLPRLIAELRRARPDAVIGFLPLGNVFGLLASLIARIPIRIASQRSPGHTYGRIMRLCDWMLGSIGLYNSIVCVSASVAQSFGHYPNAYRSRLCVVHNGIDWKPSTFERDAARSSFGIRPDLPLLVATGRFAFQKNYPLMISTVAKTPNIRLAIAGDGELRAGMEAFASQLGAYDRIHFLGNISNERVRDLLRSANGFIQTSIFEGQSNSILEAMHEALPIVCSDISMQRETLLDETGEPAALLVPLDDPPAWRLALARIRDDEDFCIEIGAKARALVERRFSLNEMTDGFEKHLRSESARI